MDHAKKIEESRHLIIDALGGAVGVYGMNETIGHIYGLLYFEEKPMSLKKIADKLGVSKATVSINIRLLLELKMVQKVWQRGSRKDFYIAERDFEKILQEVLRNKELKQVQLIKEAIERSRGKYRAILDETEDDYETDFIMNDSNNNINHDKKSQKMNFEKVKELAKKDLERLKNLESWMSKGESWIEFLLETNISEGPQEEIREIEVDWDDD